MKYAQKAADDLKSFAKKLQPLLDVAQVLEQIASLEQAGNEATVRKEKFIKEADAAKLEKEKAVKEMEAAQAQVMAAQVHAKVLEEKGNAKASQIILDAQAAAKGVEKVAFEKLQEAEAIKQDAIKFKSDYEKKVEALKLEYVELQSKIGELKLRLTNFLK
jgi:hypothetical protein